VEVEEAKVPGAIPTKLFHVKSVNDIAIRKESRFNAKVRLNMQVKVLEEEIEKLKEGLQ